MIILHGVKKETLSISPEGIHTTLEAIGDPGGQAVFEEAKGGGEGPGRGAGCLALGFRLWAAKAAKSTESFNAPIHFLVGN